MLQLWGRGDRSTVDVPGDESAVALGTYSHFLECEPEEPTTTEQRHGGTDGQSRAKTKIGSLKPFASIAGAADQLSPLPAVRSRTTWVASTWAPPAVSRSRAASWTAAPNRSPSRSIGSPAFRPTLKGGVVQTGLPADAQ